MNKRTLAKEFTCENGYSMVTMRVGTRELYGFINEKGEEVIPPQYHCAGTFRNGRASVAKRINGRVAWGYIDEIGKVVVPIIYKIRPTLSPLGEIIGNPPIEERALKTEEEFRSNQSVEERGLLSQYDWVRDEEFNENGLCVVARWSENEGIQMGVIDRTGREVVPIIYSDAIIVREEDTDGDYCLKGRVIVKDKEGRYYVFENNGKVVKLPETHKL